MVLDLISAEAGHRAPLRHHYEARIVAIACMGIVLIAGLITLLNAAFGMHTGDHPRVYTVYDVQIGLRRDPRAWVGRTVLVRGSVTAVGFDYGATGAEEMAAPGTTQPFLLPVGGLRHVVAVHLFMQTGTLRADLPYYRPLQLRTQQVQSSDPLPSILHDVPGLRNVIPTPQQVRGGVPILLRVRLLPRPHDDRACINRSCDEGMILTSLRW